MNDLVVITDTHHLRIEPETAGVRLVVMLHDGAEIDEPLPFIDAAAAMRYVARTLGVAADAWAEVTLKIYDIVVIADSDPDPEIRGLRGHVCSLADPEGAAVFVHGPDMVWCLKTQDLIPTGEVLPEADRPSRRRTIRINSNGGIL